MLTSRTTALISVATGVLLETVIHAVTGRREAWDSGLYWSMGLPLAGIVAFALGLLSRGHSWRWSAAIVPGQVTTMMALSGEIGSLWPLAMILAAILGAPLVVAAFVGSRLRGATRSLTARPEP